MKVSKLISLEGQGNLFLDSVPENKIRFSEKPVSILYIFCYFITFIAKSEASRRYYELYFQTSIILLFKNSFVGSSVSVCECLHPLVLSQRENTASYLALKAWEICFTALNKITHKEFN